MFINSSFFFLLAIAVILVIGIYVINSFQVTAIKRFQLLVTYLGGVSVILITYNIYINIRSNDRIEKNRTAYNTLTNIQRNYLQPQKELIDYYPEGFFLYASMNPDTNLAQLDPPPKFDPNKRTMIEIKYKE